MARLSAYTPRTAHSFRRFRVLDQWQSICSGLAKPVGAAYHLTYAATYKVCDESNVSLASASMFVVTRAYLHLCSLSRSWSCLQRWPKGDSCSVLLLLVLSWMQVCFVWFATRSPVTMIIMTTYGSCDANEKTMLKMQYRDWGETQTEIHICHQGYVYIYIYSTRA